MTWEYIHRTVNIDPDDDLSFAKTRETIAMFFCDKYMLTEKGMKADKEGSKQSINVTTKKFLMTRITLIDIVKDISIAEMRSS